MAEKTDTSTSRTLSAAKIEQGVLMLMRYTLFLYGITWRSVVVALAVATLTGLFLGIMASSGDWPPQQLEYTAGLIGAPIALFAVVGTVVLQVFRVAPTFVRQRA